MKDKVTRDLLRMCQNFRRLRQERGISLEELSKNTLVEECLLQCLEADDVPDALDVEQFCRMCEYLQIRSSEAFQEPKEQKVIRMDNDCLGIHGRHG